MHHQHGRALRPALGAGVGLLLTSGLLAACATSPASGPAGAPTARTGVGVSPDGRHLYVGNGGSNTVSVLDTRTNRVTATITVGTSPVSVAVSRDGTAVYVANAGSGSLSVIDARAHRTVRALRAGRTPVGVTVTPEGRSAYVADEVTASVSVVATRTGTITATVPVGEGPFDVALAPDGRAAYVAVLGPANVSPIRTPTHRLSRSVNIGPPQTDPFNIAVTSRTAYVTDQGAGTLTVIDPKALKVAAPVTVGNSPYGVAVA